jgi:hypothetical protein
MLYLPYIQDVHAGSGAFFALGQKFSPCRETGIFAHLESTSMANPGYMFPEGLPYPNVSDVTED